MRVALVLTLLTLSACRPGTSVLVRVSNSGLVVPTDLASMRIVATNPDLGGQIVYQSADLPLCAGAAMMGCYTFPVSVALRPGESRPDERVRVELTAFDAQGGVVTRDAALFSFAEGQQQQLDFTLSPRCLRTACAEQDRACGSSGGCVSVTAVRPEDRGDLSDRPLSGEPIVRWYDRVLASPIAAEFVVTPPQNTRPGDLVIALSTPVEPHPDWNLVVPFGTGVTLSMRRAGEAEASATLSYTFVPQPHAVSVNRALLLVYRGVERYELGFLGQRASGDLLPSFDVARGGALGIQLLAKVDGAPCSVDGEQQISPYPTAFWDEWGPLPAGPSGPRKIDCGPLYGVAQLWLYPR